MNKKSLLFSMLLTLGSIIMAAIALSGLIQIQKQPPALTGYGQEELSDLADQMYYYLALQEDPNYSLFTFPSEMDEEDQKQIQSMVLNQLNASYLQLRNDSNFYYSLEQGKKEISQSPSFPSDAKWELLGTIDSSDIHTSTIEDILIWNYGPKYSAKNLGYTINLPKNLILTYGIRTPILYNGRYISSLTNQDEITDPFLVFSFFMPLVLIGLLILLYPYGAEKKAPIMNKIISWKFEPAFFLAFVFGVALFLGLSLMTYSMVNHSLYDMFQMIKGIKPLAYAFYFLLWTFLYLYYGLGLFYIKHIFVDGLVRFIKQDTLLFRFIFWIKRKLDTFFQMNFFEINPKKMLLSISGIFLLITIGCNIPFFGWLMLIALFIYGLIEWNKRYVSMKQDYQITLNATKKLADGKFDEVLPYPVGSFQPIYNSLLQVKTGFEKALEEGIRSQDMKTELISNVSHDLKTPLTGIKTYVELLNSTQDPQEMQSYAQKIDNYTDRLNRLVVDLFDVSKANSKTIQLNKTPIDLVALIEQVQGEHLEQFETKELTLVETFPEHPVILDLDPDKTMRIIDNLIVNIEKYALKGTRVFVDVKEEDEEVLVQFRNISTHPLNFDPEQIVERFVRGDKSRHEIGSGLGLAIVKSFTEIQNGSFKIEIDGDLFKARLLFKKL